MSAAPARDTPDHSIALGRANEAHRIATDARDAARAIYESHGGLMRELAGLRAATSDFHARIMRELRELKRATRSSQNDIEELENARIKELHAELDEAKARAEKWRHWVLGIVAFVIGGILLGVVLNAAHLK